MVTADEEGVEDEEFIDAKARGRAFNSLLEQNPTALLSAVNSEGIFVPMPPTLKVDRSRILEGRSALDFVVAPDRVAVIEAWDQAKHVGAARCEVHIATAPDAAASLYLFDLTEDYGHFFCVLLMPEGVDADLKPDEAEGGLSRVTWTRKNEIATFENIDPNFHRILGWTREELVGKASREFIHDEDQELAIDNWMSMLSSRKDGQRVRLRHLHKDGHYVWVEIANKNLLDDPEDPHVIAQMIDISDEMAAQEALREREQLLNRLAEALPSGLLHVLADQSVVYSNERLHEIIGVPPAENLTDQLRTILRDDWPLLVEGFETVMTGVDVDLELRLRLPGANDLRLSHISMRSLSESGGTVNAAIMSVADITESAQLREELRDKATFDELTRCHNRASIMHILDEALTDPTERLAAVFIDLDRFKAINDELGHAAGDDLLVAAADRIRSAVRDGDIVGRIGGDEFLIVCPRIGSAEEAVDVAERIASVVRREVTVQGVTVDMRASVGVAWTSQEVTNADDLVARADSAMYESKRRGVGRPVAFAPALRRTDNVRLDDERALHHALGRGELAVHFQPIVELANGNAVGYESLVRWTRGQHGLPAAEFIDMAEQTGLIHDLGTHVRAEVVRGAVETRQATGQDRLWFLNLSTQELQMPGIVESVLDLVETSGLSPSSLVVEFSGTQVGDDVDTITRTAQAIEHAGVGIALDDFGARGSSLDLLRSLPLQWVKTCPTFTATMTFDKVSANIVQHMLQLADQLGVRSVVKGVETPEQRDMLIGMGATLGQGHLFAVAAPLDEILREVLDA